MHGRGSGLLCIAVLVVGVRCVVAVGQQANELNYDDAGNPVYELYTENQIAFGAVPVGEMLWVEFEVENYRPNRMSCRVYAPSLPFYLATQTENGSVTPEYAIEEARNQIGIGLPGLGTTWRFLVGFAPTQGGEFEGSLTVHSEWTDVRTPVGVIIPVLTSERTVTLSGEGIMTLPEQQEGDESSSDGGSTVGQTDAVANPAKRATEGSSSGQTEGAEFTESDSAGQQREDADSSDGAQLAAVEQQCASIDAQLAALVSRIAALESKIDYLSQLLGGPTAAAAVPQSAVLNIEGVWNSHFGLLYDITQHGADFAWYIASIHEWGTGTIDGTQLNVTWHGDNGSGSGTGVLALGPSGEVIAIEMDNGNRIYR